MPNLDSTTHCPLAEACDTCGGTDHLAVNTAETPTGGIFCLTLCETCEATNRVRNRSAVEAYGAVADHCEHLGIDLDQMARLIGR